MDFRPPHHAAVDRGLKQFGVIALVDRKPGGRQTEREFLEGVRQRDAVISDKGGELAGGVTRERGDGIAMKGGEMAQRMGAVLERFKRRKGRSQPRDQFGGDVELVVGD